MASKVASTVFMLNSSNTNSPFFSSPRTTTLSPKQQIRNVRVFLNNNNNNKHRFSVSLSSSNDTSLVGGAAAAAADFKERRPWKERDARLVLEDGSIWKVKSFGAPGTTRSDLIADTSLSSRYPKVLEDDYGGNYLVLMTYPHIENIGIDSVSTDDEEINESEEYVFGGLVVSSLCTCTSNWRRVKRLSDCLVKQGKMGIYGVDVDEIISRLAKEACGLDGVVSTDDSITDKELLEMTQSEYGLTDPEYCLTCNGSFEVSPSRTSVERFHVVVVDSGIKHYMLRRLAATGCKLTVVSLWLTSASKILKMKPDGVLMNNGPSDLELPNGVKRLKTIIGKVPVFGICCLKDWDQDYLDKERIFRLPIPTIDTISLLYSNPQGSSLKHHDHDSDSGFGEFLKVMEQAKAAKRTA